MEPFTDPKIWPCGHTFCGCCANKLAKDKRVIRCPTCNELHDVTQMRSDYALNKFCAVLDELNAKLLVQKAELETKTCNLEIRTAELEQRNRDIEEKKRELKEKSADIEARDGEILKLRKAIKDSSMRKIIQNIDSNIHDVQSKLQKLQVEIEKISTKDQTTNEQLNKHDKAMTQLKHSLKDLDGGLRGIQDQLRERKQNKIDEALFCNAAELSMMQQCFCQHFTNLETDMKIYFNLLLVFIVMCMSITIWRLDKQPAA